MKLMIMPNSISMLKQVINKVDAVMIGLDNLSVNMPTYFNYNEFLDIYNICIQNNVEIFVALNKNMHNKDLELLKNIMFKLDTLNITGIVYYDIAIVNIKLENNLKTDLVWGQEHLTTNYITANYWHKFGSGYTLVSNEITKAEILEIKEKSLSKLIVTLFGYLPMFVSERHLVKNYLKTFGLNDNSKVNYIEKENNISPIIDSNEGTIAYSSHVLNGIREVPEFKKQKIDYILLNSFLINDSEFELVIDLFNEVDDDNKEECGQKIDDMFQTDYGFLDKKTIYKVKKND